MSDIPTLVIFYDRPDDTSLLQVELPGHFPGDGLTLAQGTISDVGDLARRARKWAEDRGYVLDHDNSTLDAAQRADAPVGVIRLGTKRPEPTSQENTVA